MVPAYECVITAAGASTRMGAWKPLLPFGSSTILETTVNTALEAGLTVILVAGFRGDEIEALCSRVSGVKVVRNPLWESGLLSSVLAGFAVAEGDLVFSMNGDKPLVRAQTYRLLAAEAERMAASGLAVPPLFPSYRGKWGHPVLIPRAVALAAQGGGRMREHLASYHPVALECDDEGILLDIDTEEDYRRLGSWVDRGVSRS